MAKQKRKEEIVQLTDATQNQLKKQEEDGSTVIRVSDLISLYSKDHS